jgi:hypothetical protein
MQKGKFSNREILQEQEQQQREQALIEEQEKIQCQTQEVLSLTDQMIREKVLACLNSDQELILDAREDFYYLEYNFSDKKETPEEEAEREQFKSFSSYWSILEDREWSLVITKPVINEKGETEIRRVTETKEEARRRLYENIEKAAEKVRKDIKNSNSHLEVNEVEVDYIDNMEELTQFYQSKWMTLFTNRHFTPLNSLIAKNYRGAQDRLKALKEKLFSKGWELCSLSSPTSLSVLQIEELTEYGYNPFLPWEEGTFKGFNPFNFTFEEVNSLIFSGYQERDLDSHKKYRGKDSFEKSKSDWDDLLDSQPENSALNFCDSQNSLSSFRGSVVSEITQELRQYLKIENSELGMQFQNWEDHINNNLTNKRAINAFKNQVINNGRRKKWLKEEKKRKNDLLEEFLARAEASVYKGAAYLSSWLEDIDEQFFFTPSYQEKITHIEALKNKLIGLDQYSFRNFAEDVSKSKLQKAGWLRKEELDKEMQIKYDSLKDRNLDFSQVVTIEQELEKHIGEKWAEKKINFLQKNTNEALQSQNSLKVEYTKKEVEKFLDECEDNIYWLAHKSVAENLLTDLKKFNKVEDVVDLESSFANLNNNDIDNSQKCDDVNTEKGKQLPKKVTILLVLVAFACLVTAFQFISKEKKILSTKPFQQKRMRK